MRIDTTIYLDDVETDLINLLSAVRCWAEALGADHDVIMTMGRSMLTADYVSASFVSIDDPAEEP